MVFHIFAHVFTVCFKRQLDSQICFFIQSVVGYIVLIEVYEENAASHRCLVAQGGPLGVPEGEGTCLGPHFENHP